MENTHTITLQRDGFLDVLNRRPEVAIEILTVLSLRLRHATILLEDVVFLDLPMRLAKRFAELAAGHGVETSEGIRIDLRLTQHELAHSTGVSRESINRLLGIFQDEGLIKVDKQYFIVTDIDKLKKYTHRTPRY